MHLVVFEASKWDTFAPLTINRPVFSLLCGMSTLLDKQIRYIRPDRVTFWVRPQLAEFCRQYVIPRLKKRLPVAINTPLDDEPALISSGRALHFSRFEAPSDECVSTGDDNLIRKAYVRRPGLSPDDASKRTDKWLALLDLPRTIPQARLPDYLWDLINWNEEALVADSIQMEDVIGAPRALPPGPYHVDNADNIFVADEVKLSPGVVLDGSRGPVVVSRGSAVGANSVLQGPCYVGEYARIAALTNIRPGTTLGPGCIVGGVVANSILMGFVDKPHEGYLGDSYVGRWCNLGAGTTTANVKTTYGEVTVKIGRRSIPTGRRSMGAIIGDHTKTSINTRFSPGCYVGYCCLLAGAGLVPQFVPSFSYWTDTGIEPVDRDKGVAIASRVLERRDRSWSELDNQLHGYAVDAARAAEY
jgi:UDP-N-acetylglucosamine diphosphorylase/glucosamine-1-phosphate N-acetyltransferase